MDGPNKKPRGWQAAGAHRKSDNRYATTRRDRQQRAAVLDFMRRIDDAAKKAKGRA